MLVYQVTRGYQDFLMNSGFKLPFCITLAMTVFQHQSDVMCYPSCNRGENHACGFAKGAMGAKIGAMGANMFFLRSFPGKIRHIGSRRWQTI